MISYFKMWKNYINFSARTTVRGYWMAVLVHLIVSISLFLSIQINSLFIIALYLYAVAFIVPGFSMTVRRLRDAGKAWYWFFVGFIPVVGSLILLTTLCRPSVKDNGIPVV